MPPAETKSLDAIADRAGKLHSPPAVAMEVLRLTDEPKIDARALCKCIEGDPALASKLLRVVNSSLYGLPQQVGNLSQAIALLGVQPLKLLVLGFSLPEGLTASSTGEALQRYWTETLTIAAAARRFAEAGWGRLGDEALAAGLMQGVGQLVLLDQLGEDYAAIVASATRRGAPRTLASLEQESLGFEHCELSAELVRRWRLPTMIAEAIERQSIDTPLGHLTGDDACLAQSLSLANHLSRLLLQRDLASLSTLITLGQSYAGLGQREINKVVDSLQQETKQLAKAMAAPLVEDADYHQTLTDAHARLALLSEQSAVRMLGEPRSTAEIDEDEQLCRDLLLETRRLSAAVRVMLAGGLDPRTDEAHDEAAQPARPRGGSVKRTEAESCSRQWLLQKTEAAISDCRETRSGLVLCVIQTSHEDPQADASIEPLRGWIDQSPWANDFVRAVWAPTARNRAVVWLPGAERIEASRTWTAVGHALWQSTPMQLDVGLAGVAHPTKSFNSEALLEAAERCLAGAVAVSGPTVKSIEVF